MAIKLGKCRNYNNCDVADLNRIVEAAEDKFVCPECGRKLAEANPRPSPTATRSKLLPLLAAALLLAGLVGFLAWKYTATPEPGAPASPQPPVSEMPPPPAPSKPEPEPAKPEPEPAKPELEPAKPEPTREADRSNKPSGNETMERIRQEADKK